MISDMSQSDGPTRAAIRLRPELESASPPRAAGASRCEIVLAAAAVLFDEVGYHNVSIALIAERAGIEKADVYEMFGVKHDILYAIHEEWIDELLRLAHGRTARAVNTDDEIRRAVRQFTRDIVSVIHRRPSQVRVYFQHFRDLPPDLQKLAKAKRDFYEAQVEGVIRRGIEFGVFRAQNARVATLGLFGMCNWALQWYRAGGELTHEQIAAQLSDIFLRGVSVDPVESAAL